MFKRSKYLMKDRANIAKRVTLIGFIINLILTIAKLIAGFIGKSSAMVADGVHSMSDFITDVVVIAFINISGKESDSTHRYGHGKFETFATLLISVALFAVAFGIFYNGFINIYDAINGVPPSKPGLIALYAALVSIIFKEGLYHYTKIKGKEIKSDAVIANAWHHRSDSLSSLGTALGISGAIFLGDNWRILDPIAGVIVSFFIFKVAYQLAGPSIKELLEASLPQETINQIESVLNSHPEIVSHKQLKTRKIGSIFAIDVHIKLNRDISFIRSHDIATEVERELRALYGKDTIINIHTEPA